MNDTLALSCLVSPSFPFYSIGWASLPLLFICPNGKVRGDICGGRSQGRLTPSDAINRVVKDVEEVNESGGISKDIDSETGSSLVDVFCCHGYRWSILNSRPRGGMTLVSERDMPRDKTCVVNDYWSVELLFQLKEEKITFQIFHDYPKRTLGLFYIALL